MIREMDNRIATIDLNGNHIIRDCKTEAVNGQGGVAGGTAILIASGSSKLNNVKFLDNAADSRGGAIRCNSNKAVVFMNNCLITGNSVRELFGVGIQISSGHICMNNTTIVGNMAKLCITPQSPAVTAPAKRGALGIACGSASPPFRTDSTIMPRAPLLGELAQSA